MRRPDIFEDVAAILHPIPQPIHPEDEHDDGFQAATAEASDAQQRTAEDLRLSWEHGDQDPLIGALNTARRAKEQAEEQIRQLVAYGREFVQPRPYTLGDLAAAAGMSISGTRTAYGHRDVDAVAATTGTKPREWRTPVTGNDKAST
ncbi:hypothetical protein O7627_08050 [Solwaraspora sp. WMMD1047]|uniref:hypothetical protein n=1 Tax=Solwaraspora sp. WMMD1047 TaxID=3016102 RepID=UPI002416D8C2|nr:hypothetical protein [Solwaraspora sp. WMMD1047]MDG4829256.1 hypothetical protein [Solwaraspora sp. WMMD1047]